MFQWIFVLNSVKCKFFPVRIINFINLMKKSYKEEVIFNPLVNFHKCCIQSKMIIDQYPNPSQFHKEFQNTESGTSSYSTCHTHSIYHYCWDSELLYNHDICICLLCHLIPLHLQWLFFNFNHHVKEKITKTNKVSGVIKKVDLPFPEMHCLPFTNHL